jgi:class 3 adenylate cyclase
MIRVITDRLLLIMMLVVLPLLLPEVSGQEIPAVSRIVLVHDSLIIPSAGSYSPDSVISFNFRYNDILFEMAPCVPEDPALQNEQVFYSFYLDGNDADWSLWSPYPLKEYTNLGARDYILKVRCGVAGTIFSEDEVFAFSINRPIWLRIYFLALYLALVIVILYMAYRRFIGRHIREQVRLERIITDRTEELMAEKEKVDTLLANLLPKGTADELMAKGKASKQKFNFVTVLFSDIQGFTRIAEEVNPEILIDELDKFFFQFDTMVEKYNIEKIKTIGDAYMCAGGIPKKNRTNPIEVILAALEMQQYMEDMKSEQKRKGLTFWDIRVGIHTGTVIAGVIGHKKLSYDIWGDTVNTASRMESSGEPGKINISGITYDYVRDFFICEYRGKMPVKYKGELDMYFVNGIRPEMRQEGKNEPNQKFIDRMLMLKVDDLEEEVVEWFRDNMQDNLIFHDDKNLKNILTQAELIGRAERISDGEMILVQLASLFVMTGFVVSYTDPYSESVKIMEEKAPDYGFDKEHVQNAAAVLLDAVSESPTSVTGQIVNDAIFDYYARVDLLIRLDLLFREESSLLNITDKIKWYNDQLLRIGRHSFYTSTARLLRSNSVQEQQFVVQAYIDSLRNML